jgi:competence protein ComEA
LTAVILQSIICYMSSTISSPEPKPNRVWASAIIFLVVVNVVAIVIALVRYQPAQAIEIHLPAASQTTGSIQVGGAVANPGIYSFSGNDTIQSIIDAAGGTLEGADSSVLTLNVKMADAQTASQKININRAEVWLLQALPGIGETKAQTIVAYRDATGPFKTTADLMKVSGIGESLYNEIKDLITVID